MKNLKTRPEERDGRFVAGDWFVVEARTESFYVSAETAARVSRQLDRRWAPRWLKFVDITGARVWVRASLIESIHESTEDARGREREFHYRRRKEEMADRRWDDDEH
ncbi:MAG TPA: hypothetical protein VHG91_17915 [Longimicrobium sp.]|nr:hypothetical protein [Longimicrobium sp.]